MRFLVDAQLPPRLAPFLTAHGLEAKAVRELGLRDADDARIWSVADQGEWVGITKDEDFAERVMREGNGPRVVWLRIGNCTNRVLLGWIEPLLADIVRELEAGARVVEVRHGGW
jgi:predicted nuclease of predicted toxin-antitoxin system